MTYFLIYYVISFIVVLVPLIYIRELTGESIWSVLGTSVFGFILLPVFLLGILLAITNER